MSFEGLEPGIRAFMEAGAAFYPADAVNFTMAEQRAFYDKYCAHFRRGYPAAVQAEDFHVNDPAVPPVLCRRYGKRGLAAAPKLLYLHGGGYVLGGLESHDDICAEICDGADVEVTAVQYRLAPEHPFPAAFDDCAAVLRAIGPCVVAGDSAGGNLAAALALFMRDAGEATWIRGQVLIYPGLGGDVTKGSYITQANAPGLTTKDTLYYRDVYKGYGKFAQPLRETDYRGLPPAFLVAAGIDPLHDDCEAYAARLRAAGVAADVRDEPLLVHAFLRARHMSAPAAASFKAIIEAVRNFAQTRGP